MLNSQSTSEWSISAYKSTINSFQDAGYRLGTFEEYLKSPINKYVVLRHDLDFDLNNLEKILNAESECGVTSSVFFRVCAKNYNLASAAGAEAISSVREHGSSLGLHLDVGMERVWTCGSLEALDSQKQIFEMVSGQRMQGFSLHMPTTNQGYALADELKMRWSCSYHAYEELFFRDFKYLSDSGGNWREGHWGTFVNSFDRLQVLTHPIWHFERLSQENF
jgi:hypothetical protein